MSAADACFDASVVKLLACPACRGALSAIPERLVCGSCGLAYPVRDGIPILIPDRAEKLR